MTKPFAAVALLCSSGLVRLYLSSVRFGDHLDQVVRAFGVPARFDALGVLDRVVVPHLDSPEHPESELLQVVADRLNAAGADYLGLRDGDVWFVDGAPAGGRLLARRRDHA